MPSPIGKGRSPGQKNIDRIGVLARLESIGADPVIILGHLARGRVVCTQCLGKKKITQRRKCPRCKGVGIEYVEHDQRVRAAIALLDRVTPRLKAIAVAKLAGANAGTLRDPQALYDWLHGTASPTPAGELPAGARVLDVTKQ